MTEEDKEEMEQDSEDAGAESNKSASILEKLGALTVTLIALWYLFGIPGYILFEKFLGETVSGATDPVIEQTAPE